MNLLQIRNDILARVGTDHEISNSQIDTFINEGKSKIEAAILDKFPNFFPDTETLSFSSTETSKALTKSWTNIILIQVDYGDGRGYVTTAKQSLERVLDTNNSRPEHCVWGTTLYLTNVGLATTVRIFGFISPPILVNNADTPLFDQLLHPLIVTWGHACMLEAIDENYANGKAKRDEFDKGIEEILPVVVGYDSTNVTSLI